MARAALERIRGDESGMTMVELLVVCMVSIIVVIALFTFQDVTLRQTNRVFAKVDATQQARNAIETVVSRLRSSCVAENVIPIQTTPASTGTSITFVSKYGSAASLTPERHVVALTGTQLVDTTYQATGGTSPNWTFSSTPSASRVLLENARAVPGTPVFRYYAYGIARDSGGNNYLDAAGNPYMMLLDGNATMPSGTTTSTGGAVALNTVPYNAQSDRGSLPTPLSAANAKITSSVVITLQAGAGGNLGRNITVDDETDATVQDQVVMRITPVPSEGNLPSVPPCA